MRAPNDSQLENIQHTFCQEMRIFHINLKRSTAPALGFLILVIGLASCSPVRPSLHPGGLWYQYKSGDTLDSVAKKFQINKMDIKKANEIYDERDLEFGMRIFIPNAKQPKTAYSPAKMGEDRTRNVSLSGFIWPVAGTISSGYGIRHGRMHHGIDITKDGGSDIVAVADGIVEFSGKKKGFGNLIIIDHGFGLKTYYAHNAKNFVGAKAKVHQGQLIAKIGATGKTYGPHLHFEVRKNGKSYNPLRFLPVR